MLFSQRILLRRLLFACITLFVVMAYTLSASPTRADSSAVLQRCPSYTQSDNVSEVVLSVNYKKYSLPDNVMDTIALWQGQNTWQGYKSSNPLGLSADAHLMAKMTFILAQNQVDGQVFTNDQVQIWFWDDGSPDQLIMFPFVSIDHQFTDAAGNHLGSHLCGEYTISRADFDALLAQNSTVAS